RSQEVRFSFDNILQMNPERRLSGTANRIFPAGASDHLGHPVAADVNGFEPFEKGHARAAPRRIQLSPQNSLALADFRHKSLGLQTSARSEEHTSELQSRFDLVCRLLLEKKKKKQKTKKT